MKSKCPYRFCTDTEDFFGYMFYFFSQFSMITLHNETGDDHGQLSVKCQGSELDIGLCQISNSTCKTNESLAISCGWLFSKFIHPFACNVYV